MSPQIEKQQFKNNTQGWIGAVNLSVKGEEVGVAVEPDGTVWLSEAEQILTANAPRHAEDNPFIEQTHLALDPTTGERVEVKVTPLTPIDEARYVPANERPIPSDLAAGAAEAVAQDAATGDQPVVPISADLLQNPLTREDQILANGPDTRPHEVPAPTRAAAAAAAAAEAPEPTPEPPEPTPEPQPQPTFPLPAAPVPPAADDSRAIPTDEGRASEETAVQSPGPAHEETGAAVPPTATAPEGEYQANEEVGTPAAPAADVSAPAPAEETGQQPPAPWNPETEG